VSIEGVDVMSEQVIDRSEEGGGNENEMEEERVSF
jgi:hypothetical protein